MVRKRIEVSDEAYLSLEKLKRPRESFSDLALRLSSEAHPRSGLVRRLCFVLWGYCFAVWLYVIAYQLKYPDAICQLLVSWLPIRMDYMGEAAFVLSFIFAVIIVVYRPAAR